MHLIGFLLLAGFVSLCGCKNAHPSTFLSLFLRNFTVLGYTFPLEFSNSIPFVDLALFSFFFSFLFLDLAKMLNGWRCGPHTSRPSMSGCPSTDERWNHGCGRWQSALLLFPTSISSNGSTHWESLSKSFISSEVANWWFLICQTFYIYYVEFSC